MRNWKALWAFLVALLALAVLLAAAAAAEVYGKIELLEAGAAVPAAGLLALLSLSLARRARAHHQRTLGRSGGVALAALGRGLAIVALLLALTAALALAVFVVLVVMNR